MESVPSRSENRPVSLKEVAQAAGVGVATASRALSGRPRVSELARQRVRKAADDLGYRPDPLLAALGSRKFRQSESRRGLGIALLNRVPPGVGAAKFYQEGVHRRAEALGYRVVPYDCQDFGTLEPLHKEFRSLGIGAAILTPWHDGFDLLEDFDWGDLVVVQSGRSWKRTAFECVRDDVYAGVLAVWEQALERGYRRPGFVLYRHAPMHPDDFDREAAAAQCLRLAGMEGEQLLLVHEVQEPFEKALLRWFRKSRPDCIITMPHGVLFYLRRHGLLENYQPGYLSLSTDLASNHNNLTGLGRVEDKIGEAAVDQIDFHLRRGERGLPDRPRTISFHGEWHEGSTAPGPGKSPT